MNMHDSEHDRVNSTKLNPVPDISDQRLVEAFDRAAVALSLSDPSGRILAANDDFYELFGYDRATDLDVGMLSRPGDQEWTLSYLTRLVTGDLDEFRTVKRFVRADGTEFDGNVVIRALLNDGMCTGLIARTEPVLVRPGVNDELVRKLLVHSAGTLTLVDEDGNVTETTGRYRETLGYPTEYWEQRTILDVIVPDDLERVMEVRNEVLAAPDVVITEDFRVQRADRKIETLEVTVRNMLDDDDLRGIVLSTRNVTAERNNIRAVANLRDEAVAEAEHRSNLLATVSHELRNPLHAMSGLAELLASDDTLTEGPRDLAATLQRQLNRLTSVTDDLLDAARMEVGRFELRPAPVAVRDLVRDVTRVARSAADGRIEVLDSVADDVPHLITVDPARLQQVLGNLVGNAVKFTEQGSVTLSVSKLTDEDSPGRLRFDVVDTGVGIPREQLARVFEPFATATTSGDRRGAGLGLAIVQRLVEAFGGVIDVDSTLGKGSEFSFSIPLVSAVEGPDVDRTGPIARPRRERVLVVEDTPVNQQLARLQLDRLGLEGVIAESAEVGLRMLNESSFDVILMDHQLPGMNGRDATREIRRRGITTPIIGVTASSTAADEQACLDAGMDAFLPKPVGLERLRVALQKTMSAAEQAVAAEESAVNADAATDVDVAVLDGLVEELGDRSVVEGLVRTFLTELDARRSDVAGADSDLAARQAHTLKSSARLLGATALADLCSAAEHDPAARPGIGVVAAAARTGLTAWLGQDHPEATPS